MPQERVFPMLLFKSFNSLAKLKTELPPGSEEMKAHLIGETVVQ